jgi:tetrahydromethanopterin S-methyltransferase subunit F
MARERFSTRRAQLAQAEKTRVRRSRERAALARRLGRARRLACALMAIGGAGIAAGIVLMITGHLVIGVLPLIAGAPVLYRGERGLSRVDAVIRKQLYGDAAALWIAKGPGRVGGTYCAAGHGNCGGSSCGGGDCGGGDGN